MKKCSICKKNIAVMYNMKIEDGNTKMEGICLECAAKMGIPVKDQLMKQLSLDSEDMENISEQMKDMFDGMNMDDLLNMSNSFEENNSIEDKNDDIEIDENKEEISENDFQEFDFKNDSPFKKIFSKTSSKKKSKKLKTLYKYATNLTKKALDNEIDNIIGREEEIQRVIQILNRRNKNNPVLLGEPGVGKTAIAEGLALKIATKEVPSKLYDKEVFLLDLTAIVAGTQFRGQFEGRMKGIIEEVKQAKNIILIIDEIHNIMGAGEVHGGVMNAANILKPALSKGEVQIIGATTKDEYRKHIEKDKALERRFQPIIVDEPNISDSIKILSGIKNYYETHHKVNIEEDIISASVVLSNRYITERYLPDKAIDLIDEASSKLNLKFYKKENNDKYLVEKIDQINDQIENLSLSNDYEEIAKLKMKKLKFEEQLEELNDKKNWPKLTKDDIAQVIEDWTKIPVKTITKEEASKLINLETNLHKSIIGQNEAIKSLSRTVRRNRAGFKNIKRPSSFIFSGPTGVGKTATVKALAKEVFGSEENLIRVDMSEYMEKHSVSKLIGSPPGYVGFDDAGQLTEKIRRNPYSVVLFDEIEKAHPDVFNMLLQILDDGILTDSQGKNISFKNTIIVLTSNAGSSSNSSIGFNSNEYEALEEKTSNALKELFRPEFLNRIDEIITFRPLEKDELFSIIDLMLKDVQEEALDKNIKISYTSNLKEFIFKKGFDQKYGARPLRRAIQKYIEDELAEEYLLGKIDENQNINIDYIEDSVKVTVNN
ncbi:MAG: ATP-dependent Clp protease ATP-binding subunit [Peptostreptococcaceae bacterium]|jgi:ATP-dependent Clp protease ATP-binding subunit ClpA|nr:ATP-dependent Clp protease ATP-binding subunit [Peptostreptococcaceae bacterium]